MGEVQIHRKKELEAVCKFVKGCDEEELSRVLGEILHNTGLWVRGEDGKTVYSVLGMHVNPYKPMLILGNKEE